MYGNAVLRVPQLGTGVGRGHVDGGRTTTSGHSPGAALKLRDVLTPSASAAFQDYIWNWQKFPVY